MTQSTEQPGRPGASQPEQHGRLDSAPLVEVHRRRTPKYPAFMGVGIFLGVLVAGALTFSVPPTDEYSRGAVLGYTSLALALVGGALGGVLALLLDRRR